MKRWGIILILVIIAGLGTALFLILNYSSSTLADFGTVPSEDDLVAGILAERVVKMEQGEVTDLGEEHEINVLLLGLDSRKNWEDAHCDAIHMLTFNLDADTLIITSVPRGTYSYIPNGPYGETEYYLANACYYAGLDYGIEQIERYVGKTHDYLVTVGFSQAMGVFRLFDLPEVETLQWLRHRQSYQIGEPQRSHNQAVFMKDMIVANLATVTNDFSLPLQYVAYRMVNTDMDFATARGLLAVVEEMKLNENPDSIVLQMRPYYETIDLHFDPENIEDQLAAITEFLRPYLGDEDLSEKSIEEIQAELIDYLDYRLGLDESVADVYEQQMWRQLSDESERERLHYAYVERYAHEIGNDSPEEAAQLVLDYVLEKEVLGPEEYAKMGATLHESIIETYGNDSL